MKNDPIIVAIDGPAGAGKSTVAKALADRLGFNYLDTGAMYRSLTLKALGRLNNLEDEDALVGLARETVIDMRGNSKEGLHVFLDGQDVSEDIRTVEVTNNTFYIARAPRVREIMVKWQREIGARDNVVMEGRDIGTVVFPEAQCKFYLDATVEERASRRHKEFLQKGKNVSLEEIINDVRARDEKDFTRSVGALKKAHDATVVDSTNMTIHEVVETMVIHVTGRCSSLHESK
ncbi:MAG: (d)CMP kinase [Candidatus Omnitrophota bacterium]